MTVTAAAAWDSARARLRAGVEALGLQVTAAVLQGLLDYLALLERWNRIYNLTAVRDPQQMVTQHLLDCLAAVPALDRHLKDATARLLDVGSGAGLPGVVLAIMRPHWRVCCVDTVAKKATFIRQAGGELGLTNLDAVHARVEALQGPGFDVITSRAFASLADFTAMTARHLAPGGCWLAMKGKLPQDEIAALPPEVEVFHVEQLQVPGLGAQRCLVWMRPR
jgi:16S rRNA (guanine527-N7)-methyltransferase